MANLKFKNALEKNSAPVGFLVARFAFPERLGRVIPGGADFSRPEPASRSRIGPTEVGPTQLWPGSLLIMSPGVTTRSPTGACQAFCPVVIGQCKRQCKRTQAVSLGPGSSGSLFAGALSGTER
jgi:hypothetical protein